MEEDLSKYYLLYDGECPFCNFWVQFVLKRDREKRFLFAPLQSRFGQRFLSDRNLGRENFNTVYLYRPGRFYYQKARAAFEVLALLGGIYHFPAVFRFLPSFITDPFYDFVARYRKRIAADYCFLPTAEERKRFVE